MSRSGTVIFDLDGTLVDSERLVARAINESLTGFGTAMPSFCESMVRGKLFIDRARILQECAGVPMDPELFANRLRDRYDEIWRREGIPMMIGAEALLKELRRSGMRLGLTSNGDRAYVEAILKRCGWSSFFDATVAFDDVGSPKPDPAIYRETLRRLQVSAEQAAAIEDSLAGMESAHAAGVHVIAVTEGTVPPWVIQQVRSLEELSLDGLKTILYGKD